MASAVRCYDASNPSFARSPQLNTEATGSAPDAFGPIRVLHQIGAGTLGPVFRAHDTQRHRLVAVKVFKLDMPPERVHQLLGELEWIVAARLAFRAIATPLAAGMTGLSAYLASEYVAAESLDLTIREFGPSTPEHALHVAAQLAFALDHAAMA